MIVTDKLIFVHVPRTAGTLMRHFLRDKGKRGGNFDFFREDGGHGGIGLARHLHLTDGEPWPETRFAFVRNPFDWLVSYYRFWVGHWKKKTGAYSQEPSRWTEYESLMATHSHNHGNSFPDWVAAIYGARLGLKDWIRKLCSAPKDLPGRSLRLLRFEDLPGGLWSRFGIPWWDNSFSRLWEAGRVNQSPAQLPAYFSQGLVDLVLEVEKDLIKEFGYEIPKA